MMSWFSLSINYTRVHIHPDSGSYKSSNIARCSKHMHNVLLPYRSNLHKLHSYMLRYCGGLQAPEFLRWGETSFDFILTLFFFLVFSSCFSFHLLFFFFLPSYADFLPLFVQQFYLCCLTIVHFPFWPASPLL